MAGALQHIVLTNGLDCCNRDGDADFAGKSLSAAGITIEQVERATADDESAEVDDSNQIQDGAPAVQGRGGKVTSGWHGTEISQKRSSFGEHEAGRGGAEAGQTGSG